MSFNDDWNKGYGGQAPPSGGSALDSWQAGKATAEWNRNALNPGSGGGGFDGGADQSWGSPLPAGGGGGSSTDLLAGRVTGPGLGWAPLRWIAYVLFLPATMTAAGVAILGAPVLLVLSAGKAGDRPGLWRCYRVSLCAGFFYLVAMGGCAYWAGAMAQWQARLGAHSPTALPAWVTLGQLIALPVFALVVSMRLTSFRGPIGFAKALLAGLITAAIGSAVLLSVGMTALSQIIGRIGFPH